MTSCVTLHLKLARLRRSCRKWGRRRCYCVCIHWLTRPLIQTVGWMQRRWMAKATCYESFIIGELSHSTQLHHANISLSLDNSVLQKEKRVDRNYVTISLGIEFEPSWTDFMKGELLNWIHNRGTGPLARTNSDTYTEIINALVILPVRTVHRYHKSAMSSGKAP